MGKIIDPVSYKKMAESYAKPAYKLREGVGAGYQLTFIDIKLTNVKVGKAEKDADGFNVAKFTADIVPGKYGWYADHPYWTAAPYGNPEPYNFDSSMNPYASKAVITGGKVEGLCDDGGTAWRSEGSPWSEEQFIEEIESETFVIQDSYSGGWIHSSMTDTLEWESEVRGSYEHYIDDTPSERGNLAVIEKISFNFDPDWVADYEEALDYAENPDREDWYEEDEWDDADDESPAFYDDPDSGRQWYESKMRESKSEDIKYLKYLLRKEEVTALDDEERWELQDLINKYGYPEEYDESKGKNLNEYTVKEWFKDNPYPAAYDKADPLDRYYAIQVKEVNPEYRRYFHHTADVGDFWAGSAFTFVDEFGDAELYETSKKAEEALKEVNDAMGRLAKHKRFEGRPYEFEIVGGYKNVLTERIHKKTYSDHIVGYTEPGEDEEIFYDRKHAGYVSDGQAYIRKDCPEEVYETFPDYIETNLSFLEESKLNEDILSSQVRQSVLDVQAAKKQVDEDVAVLDKKVDKVSNDLVRIATNRRDVISEAKTRFVELDSPLKISSNGKIDEIEVKKILRKLAADRILRVNAHYNIKDSEGKVTYWDFLHSQDEGYQYVFVQEMTGNYCYSNMLYLNKRRGKIDLKNTRWSSYEIPEDYYDSYKMTEATRLTHRIVLKPEDSGYRLTHADKLRFHSKEDAESKLSQMNASMGSRLASKGLHLEVEEIPYTPKPRNTRTQDPDYENPFEVGDILEGDFGYSMILPVWVQVVSKTAKTVTVRRLDDKVISHDGYGQAGTKLPIPNSFSKGWGDSYEEQRCIVKKGYRTGESDPKKRYFIDFQGKMMNIWDGEARDFDTYD